MIIWNTNTGKELASFEWKKSSKEGPKSIKFTKDEKFCARLSGPKTIEIYEGGDFSKAKYKIQANEETLSTKKKSEKTENESSQK